MNCEKGLEKNFGRWPTATIGRISEEIPAGITKEILEQIRKKSLKGLQEKPFEALQKEFSKKILKKM